jgi:hypothetical protein
MTTLSVYFVFISKKYILKDTYISLFIFKKKKIGHYTTKSPRECSPFLKTKQNQSLEKKGLYRTQRPHKLKKSFPCNRPEGP